MLLFGIGESYGWKLSIWTWREQPLTRRFNHFIDDLSILKERKILGTHIIAPPQSISFWMKPSRSSILVWHWYTRTFRTLCAHYHNSNIKYLLNNIKYNCKAVAKTSKISFACSKQSNQHNKSTVCSLQLRWQFFFCSKMIGM
jgi:hypothetical protein